MFSGRGVWGAEVRLGWLGLGAQVKGDHAGGAGVGAPAGGRHGEDRIGVVRLVGARVGGWVVGEGRAP